MKDKIKITFVISGVDYSLGFLWLSKYIDTTKYDSSFIFLSKSSPALLQILRSKGIKSTFLPCRNKFDYFKIFLRLIVKFVKDKPDIVHAHLLEAGLISLAAARIAFIKKRIYTRHHATYNRIYYPHMVKFDKFINTIATHIIAISNNVAEVLIKSENVPPSKVVVIPHGFEFENFIHINKTSSALLREKYNNRGKRPVIGVISRFIELKGLQYIIPAFERILKTQPDALLIMANASGDYSNTINDLLSKLPSDSYIKIEFERDLFSLYSIFDYFIHAPIDPSVEAFGQVYIEALAAGIPSIFTLSGIAPDFIVDEKNALVVPFQNSEAIYSALKRLCENNSLKEKLVLQGREDVLNLFSFEKSLLKMYSIYEG
ncbi:MAG: glycosyltransferase family 4 protein [Bacteroidetes bacterium]|nr:glycosyltransferase family 4 protein [Bacteroidota bacterium]